MEISRILKSRQLIPTGMNKLKPTDTNWYDNDRLYEQLSDLVNPQFRAWYCRKFYLIGTQRVLELASQARVDAKVDKRRLFSYLLKKADAKTTT